MSSACSVILCTHADVVSFAAIFWMSRNAPPKETKVSLGGALRDIQKTAAKETNADDAMKLLKFMSLSIQGIKENNLR